MSAGLPCAGKGSDPVTPARSVQYTAERAKTDAKRAVRVAQNLFAASSAFATTNNPAPVNTSIPPRPPRKRAGKPYKALIVLFMAGGADTFNMLIPHSKCDNRTVNERE